MAFVAISVMTEGNTPIMTGPAISSAPIIGFGYFGGICFHGEIQFGMTNAACIFSAMQPMRKGDRPNSILSGYSVYEDVSIELWRYDGRQIVLHSQTVRNTGVQSPRKGRAD